MVENAERALAEVCKEFDVLVRDYTVAPIYLEGDKKGGHEWLIEFEGGFIDKAKFEQALDLKLQSLNSDYEAKRFNDMAMEQLKLHVLPAGSFDRWMRKREKFGGQNKVPRLSNSREHLESILELLVNH